ncbi:hypothetical protein AMTR_s00102p00087570 [Amborella trichopoda]|uniref:Uncharacterized protein n=1 Tax=Amborella trichopoda TaxID=13333 RepID=W1NZ02_AMBTC|nr:hypothetical protein AMTR_s00102p00087570 [Amborella trichopoda]
MQLTVLRPLAPHHVNGVDHVPREQERTTWNVMHLTALRPLLLHQFNGADHFEREQERAMFVLKDMHLAALKPFGSHQDNGVDSDGDESSDGELHRIFDESELRDHSINIKETLV